MQSDVVVRRFPLQVWTVLNKFARDFIMILDPMVVRETVAGDLGPVV